MIGDIRINIEKERAKNCIFITLLWKRNEGKSGLTAIDGKFTKLFCHTEPTAFRHDCVQILEETILLTPLLCNSQERWRRLTAGSTSTTRSGSSGSSSSSSSSRCLLL